MTRAKPRTIAAGKTALCHMRDAQECLRYLAKCLAEDGIEHNPAQIVAIGTQIEIAITPLERIMAGLKNPLTNIGT